MCDTWLNELELNSPSCCDVAYTCMGAESNWCLEKESDQKTSTYSFENCDFECDFHLPGMPSVPVWSSQPQMSGGGGCRVNEQRICRAQIAQSCQDKERAQLNRDICHLESQVQSYSNDLQNFEVCYHSIYRSAMTVKNRTARVIDEIEIHKRELQQARILNNQKITTTAQIKGQVNCHRIRLENLKVYIKDLEDKLQCSLDAQKTIMEEMQTIKSKVVQQEETKKDLKALQGSIQHKKQSLEAKINEERSEINKLKLDIHGICLDMKVTVNIIFDCNVKMKEMENCEKSINEGLEVCSKKKEELESAMMAAEEKVKNFRKETDAMRSDFQTECSRKRDEIRRLETDYLDIQIGVNESTLAIKRFKESLNALNSEFNVFVLRMQRQATLLGQVKEETSKKQGQKAILTTELEDARANLKKHEEKKAALLAEVEASKIELREVYEIRRAEKATFMDNHHILKNKVEKTKSENLNVKDKLDVIEAQAQNCDRVATELIRCSRRLERKALPLQKEIKERKDVNMEHSRKLDNMKITLRSLNEFRDRVKKESMEKEMANDKQKVILDNTCNEINKTKDLLKFVNDEVVTARMNLNRESYLNLEKTEDLTALSSRSTFTLEAKTQKQLEVSNAIERAEKHLKELKRLEKATAVKIEGLRDGNDDKRKQVRALRGEIGELEDEMRMKQHGIKLLSQDVSRVRKEMGHTVDLLTKYEKEHHRTRFSLEQEIEALQTAMFRTEHAEQEERRRMRDKFSQRLCCLYHKQRKIQEKINDLKLRLIKVKKQGQGHGKPGK